MKSAADRHAEIVAAGARFALHINYGDGYGYGYICNAEPRIGLTITGPKGRKSKRTRSRVFTVDGVTETFLTLEEAIGAVMKIDQDAEEAALWDASAPKKPKPAAIPGMLEDEP